MCLTLLHSERPKLHRVLTVLSAIGLNVSALTVDRIVILQLITSFMHIWWNWLPNYHKQLDASKYVQKYC